MDFNHLRNRRKARCIKKKKRLTFLEFVFTFAAAKRKWSLPSVFFPNKTR